jgi:hypothetical protein
LGDLNSAIYNGVFDGLFLVLIFFGFPFACFCFNKIFDFWLLHYKEKRDREI